MFREDLSWRGATLAERVDHVRARISDETTGHPVAEDERLLTWARACAQGDLAAFSRRLSWDDIDAHVAIAAMAADSPSDFPISSWTRRLPELVAEARTCAPEVGTSGWEASVARVGTESPFVDVWVPLLQCARRRLSSAVPRVREWISDESISILERQLLKEVSRLGELVLFEDFKSDSSRAASTPSADRYLTYIRDVLASRCAAILSRYPVLARHVILLVDQWVDEIGALTRRLKSDQALIETTFGRPAGRVSRVTPALSDRHAGTGRVTRVEFASGLRLAYKPRHVGLECAFHRCLSWLMQRGLVIVPRPLRVVDQGTHGWVEWVEQDSLPSRASAAAYFRAAGALVCIAHVLGATDLHSENLIAAADGPVLVDTEMLLQPSTGPPPAAEEWHDDHSSVPPTDSCLASGLVSAIVVDKSGNAFDVGGLRQSESRELSVPTRVWKNLRRDDIGYVLEHRIHPVLRNDVRVDGRVCRPEQFADEICEGFEATYNFFASNRRALLAQDGPLGWLAQCRTRVLFRPSDQYAIAQSVMASPRYQRRGLDRSLAIETFSRVFAQEPERPRIWPLVRDERESLEFLNIPRQTLPVSTTDLTASTGEVVPGVYAASGIEGVHRRLSALSPDDLTCQIDSLRTALGGHDAPFVVLQDEDDRDSGDELRAAAERVGWALLARAHQGADGSLRWLSSSGQGDLYRGACGMGLFFAALGAVTGRETWRDAARRSLRSIFSDGPGTPTSNTRGIGGCTGRPSIAYAVALAGHLMEDEHIVSDGAELASTIPVDAIDSDDLLDIEGGAAGALAALLAVNELRPNDHLLSIANRCADRLVATQVQAGPERGGWRSGVDGRARPGFAHGAAGIAFALGRWVEHSEDQAVLDAVRRAWDFERRVFLADGGWPTIDGHGGRFTMVAWCHGAPGIALARASAPASVFDASVTAEITVAMSQTLSVPSSQLDHLCCGNLGRADVALTVGLQTETPSWTEHGVTAAKAVAGRVLSQDRLGMRGRGFHQGAPAPGFFQGLAGIGYQLLRTSSPSRLPSVLAFQTPTGSEHRRPDKIGCPDE